MIARKTIFSGNVQGVGFRMTTRNLARGFTVAGTVRNLDNGDVEVICEGEQTEVERFLAAIEETMNGFIESRSDAEEPVRNRSGFAIRH